MYHLQVVMKRTLRLAPCLAMALIALAPAGYS
ncbi:MAG: hypothetical protein ACI8QC_001885 [Planctomycetota bacterium]|jgi:hypothetical protein